MPEARIDLLCRGDRVRVRLAVPDRPGPHPLIVWLSADGTASAGEADAALADWSSWAAVATLDLPLCGRRSSEKLTDAAFDSSHPLHARLRPEVESQFAADLDLALAHLGSRDDVDAGRIGLVARGRAAALAETLSNLRTRFRRVVICADAAATPDWLGATGAALRHDLG